MKETCLSYTHYVPSLQNQQRLGEVFGILELRNEREESDMPSIGENDIGHAGECCRKARCRHGLDLLIGPLNANGDHRNQHGREDGCESWESR